VALEGKFADDATCRTAIGGGLAGQLRPLGSCMFKGHCHGNLGGQLVPNIRDCCSFKTDFDKTNRNVFYRQNSEFRASSNCCFNAGVSDISKVWRSPIPLEFCGFVRRKLCYLRFYSMRAFVWMGVHGAKCRRRSVDFGLC